MKMAALHDRRDWDMAVNYAATSRDAPHQALP
jgi:hypothetical protein